MDRGHGGQHRREGARKPGAEAQGRIQDCWRGLRKGTNGVSTNGFSADFIFF